MIKRLIAGTGISLLIVMGPVLWNIQALRAPHLWILLAFVVIASLCQPGYNFLAILAQPGDRGTGAQIIGSVYLTQVAAVLECVYVRYPESLTWDAASTVALVTMMLGLALRTWAVLTLGRFFTMHMAVQNDQSLVRGGPYRCVRHPSYLGAFIMYMSTTAFLHAWTAAAAAIVLLPLAFIRRMRYEDELLKKKFGQEYESYRADVWKIIPGIW